MDTFSIKKKSRKAARQMIQAECGQREMQRKEQIKQGKNGKKGDVAEKRRRPAPEPPAQQGRPVVKDPARNAAEHTDEKGKKFPALHRKRRKAAPKRTLVTCPLAAKLLQLKIL